MGVISAAMISYNDPAFKSNDLSQLKWFDDMGVVFWSRDSIKLNFPNGDYRFFSITEDWIRNQHVWMVKAKNDKGAVYWLYIAEIADEKEIIYLYVFNTEGLGMIYKIHYNPGLAN
jgi:hypothetical protein